MLKEGNYSLHDFNSLFDRFVKFDGDSDYILLSDKFPISEMSHRDFAEFTEYAFILHSIHMKNIKANIYE